MTRPDLKKLFWPRRFPRIKRFPRFRSAKPGMCYCGRKATNNFYVQDPLSENNKAFRGFCSELCYDVYFAQIGRSYMWMKQKFEDIRQGRKDPRFYEIRRFPRRKK
jgi:hypothetical protein